jgi:hypothetical protein
MLAFAHCLDARFGWKDSFETALRKASAYADRALELDSETLTRISARASSSY